MAQLANTRYPYYEIVAYPNPGVGVDLLLPGLANARSELIALSFSATTDATAADRALFLELFDGTNTIQISVPRAPQTASQSIFYTCTSVISLAPAGVADQFPITFQPEILIAPTWRLQVAPTNWQAGDAITMARAIWKRWPWNF